MGFYNYYRLLKEIRYLLKNKKFKKILTIIIIFFIIISILHINGYCATNYNIFPPLHGQSTHVEMIIKPQLVTFDFWFDYKDYTFQKETNYDTTGYYFYLVPGWDYFIVNNSDITFNYLFCEDIPSVGTHFSYANFGVHPQNYLNFGGPVSGGDYCYFYWDSNLPFPTFTIYAYMQTSKFPLDKSSAEYYLNSIEYWVKQVNTNGNQNVADIIANNTKNTEIINNSLTNSDVDVADSQLVTDSTQDITQDGYNNIFEMIRSAFTGSPTAITFPIPFVNQSFTLQPDFLSHYLQVRWSWFFCYFNECLLVLYSVSLYC